MHVTDGVARLSCVRRDTARRGCLLSEGVEVSSRRGGPASLSLKLRQRSCLVFGCPVVRHALSGDDYVFLGN